MTAAETATPTTSIVILTRNGLDVTRACIESIARHTPEPHELVFVDNGSTDGTLEYLRSLPGAVVIDNDRNLGFGGGCNQGIAASTGDRILLLNNDVVVTHDWLGALHRALDSDARIGMVGPRSNRVAGLQLVADVGYDTATLDGLDAYAATWCSAHAGSVDVTLRIIGFCMLVERAVIERIGGFDLRFGLGNFEDDDLCMRTVVAGWGIGIANDSFIHHVGSQTFTGEGIDYSSTMGENFGRFARKWGLRTEEYDAGAGSYRADLIVARATFSSDVHRSPLVGVPDGEVTVSLGDGVRARRLLVACDRFDPEATDIALRAALGGIGPDDDVSVVVRLDPRDTAGYAALDAAADAVGDAALPDVVLVEARDENDLPVLAACSAVLAFGRRADTTRQLARDAGIEVVESGNDRLDMFRRAVHAA